MLTETIRTSIPTWDVNHSLVHQALNWADFAEARQLGPEDSWYVNTNSSVPRNLSEKIRIQRTPIANIYNNASRNNNGLIGVDKNLFSPYKGGVKTYIKTAEYYSKADENGSTYVFPVDVSITISCPVDDTVPMDFIRKSVDRCYESTFEYDPETQTFTDRLEAIVRGSIKPKSI